MAKGQAPVIAFLGQKTFFTELKPVGELSVPIAPGDYVFKVAHGDNFLAQPARVKVSIGTTNALSRVADHSSCQALGQGGGVVSPSAEPICARQARDTVRINP